jgi:hypothetical protein
MEGLVDWHEKGACVWENMSRVLQVSWDGPEKLDWDTLFPQDVADLA